MWGAMARATARATGPSVPRGGHGGRVCHVGIQGGHGVYCATWGAQGVGGVSRGGPQGVGGLSVPCGGPQNVSLLTGNKTGWSDSSHKTRAGIKGLTEQFLSRKNPHNPRNPGDTRTPPATRNAGSGPCGNSLLGRPTPGHLQSYGSQAPSPGQGPTLGPGARAGHIQGGRGPVCGTCPPSPASFSQCHALTLTARPPGTRPSADQIT